MGKRFLKVIMIIIYLLMLVAIYTASLMGAMVDGAVLIILLTIQYIIYGSVNPLYLFKKEKKTLDV